MLRRRWDIEGLGLRRGGLFTEEGFAVAVEDVEVFVLAVFQGRVQVLEDPDAKLRLQQSDSLEALPDVSFHVEARDDHPHISLLQNAVDPGKRLRR